MNGFEYQFAGLLVSEGKVDEGIEIVRAVSKRYNGYNRNPYSEIECGSNYARSMASFAILPILSGFEFDLPRGIIGFNPKVNKDNFRCIWSLGSGWGGVEIKNDSTVIKINSGSLKIKELHLPYLKSAERLIVDGAEIPFSLKDGKLTFAEITVKSRIKVN